MLKPAKNPGAPTAPGHLSDESKKWWVSICSGWQLDEAALSLLRLACEAWDRTQQAREILDREGLTVIGAEGGTKAHPAIGVERDSRLAFARLLRELRLDDAPAPDPRPSRLSGARRAR